MAKQPWDRLETCYVRLHPVEIAKIDQLAEQLAISRSAFLRVAANAALRVEIEPLKLLPITAADLATAKVEDATSAAARRYATEPRPPSRRKPNPRDVEIMAMRRAGLTLPSIAARVGLTRQRVHQIILALDPGQGSETEMAR